MDTQLNEILNNLEHNITLKNTQSVETPKHIQQKEQCEEKYEEKKEIKTIDPDNQIKHIPINDNPLITNNQNEPSDITELDTLKTQLQQTTEELLQNYRSDRFETKTFIDMLKQKINADNPVKPTRIYYEALSTTLGTQSQTNTNLLKIIETLNRRIMKIDTGEDDMVAELSELFDS